MIIVWDEPKRLSNLQKHGLDFADLDQAFFEHARVIDARLDRLASVGRTGALPVIVVFKPLGQEAISVISMRCANKKERGYL